MANFMQNVNSRKLLAVREASINNGAQLIQWDVSRDGSQGWDIEATANVFGRVLIRNARSGKVIDVPGGTPQRGVQLIQYDYHGGNNQLWDEVLVTENGVQTGAVAFRNVATGQLIDVEGASRNAGDHIIQWPQSGGIRQNQQWIVTSEPIFV